MGPCAACRRSAQLGRAAEDVNPSLLSTLLSCAVLSVKSRRKWSNDVETSGAKGCNRNCQSKFAGQAPLPWRPPGNALLPVVVSAADGRHTGSRRGMDRHM